MCVASTIDVVGIGRHTGFGGATRLLAVSVLLATAGCASNPAESHCSVPPSNVDTIGGWTGYLDAHREDVAVVVDDGRGSRITHRAGEIHPTASASKVLNAAAYAQAVANGTAAPEEPVRVGDWERWAVTGGGEQAHVQALDHLGIPRDGTRARDPNRTVPLDQVVNQMMIWSDNAAPDFLRDRLGDRALTEAALAVGWEQPELPSTTGFTVSLFTPELLPPSADRPTRRATEWQIARRYAYDPAFRADVDSRPVPPGFDEPRFVDGGPGGTAEQLASLWSAIGHEAFPGADIARRLGEQDPDPGPGLLGVGVKGGSTPGVLARGTEIRRDDGTVAVAVVLVRRMSTEDTDRINRSSQAFSDFVAATVQDPAVLTSLRCRFAVG